MLTSKWARVICLISISFAASNLLSQSKTGDKLLEEGDHKGAHAAYRAGLSEEKDAAQSHFGLARVFADSNYASYELDSAYDHANQALEVYRSLHYKVRSKVSKKFSTRDVSDFKRQVEERALAEAEAENTVAAFEAYMERYQKARYKQRRLAEEGRNRAALQEAEKAGNSRAFEELLEHYGSSMRERTPAVYERAQMRLFESYIRENSWAAYDTFAQRHPENVYVQDSIRGAFEKIRGSGNLLAYKRLARLHPLQPFGLLARDSLATLLLAGEELSEVKYFLNTYPEHERRQALWRHYYHLNKQENNTVRGLKDFQRRHPDFPFPELLEPDIRLAIGREAEEVLRGEDFERCRQFIETYPQHERAPEVWLHFYELYKQRDNSMAAIRHFQHIYPAFPQPGLFERDIQAAVSRNYRSVMEDNDADRCLRFVSQHPDYLHADSVWWKYFTLFLKEKPPLAEVRAFSTAHPAFPFPDSLRAAVERIKAQEEPYELEAVLSGCSLKRAKAFLEDYPNSRFRPQLEGYLFTLVSDFNDEASYRFFLQSFPESRRRAEIGRRLYKLLAAEGRLEALEEFAKGFPGLIDEGELRRALGIARMAQQLDIQYFDDSRRAAFAAFIKGAAPHALAFDALWVMLRGHLEYEEWEEAKIAMRAFQPYFRNENRRFNQLQGLLSEPIQKLEARSLGEVVNSRAQEFEPVISTDGGRMYFTGRGRVDNLGGEDIFLSEKVDGDWQAGQLVPMLSSRSDNESAESVSADGQSMILFKSGKLSYSEWRDSSWTLPAPMPPQINCGSWQADARLTADGSALLFAARKENGDIDIYVSVKQEDGSWGERINLGPMINTRHTDRSPFLHPDMKTLYFSSAGHIGLGKLDVFKSVRLDSSWANWSEPANLGRVINNKGDNWGYRISTDGELAYYSALDGGSTRNLDLFEIGVPTGMQPDELSTVRGLVISQNGQPLEAELIWRVLETKKEVQRLDASAGSGEFFLTLPRRIRYSYTARAEGYFPQSGSIDLSDGHRDLSLEIVLTSLEEMKSEDIALPIDNLFFETAKYEIQPPSFPSLDELAAAVITHELAIEILGHTDNVGEESDNLLLSRNRAEAVRAYLLEKGCRPERLLAKGFGESQPIDTNDSREGRGRNRRVEIRVVR